MAQRLWVRKGQLFPSSRTGASRSMGRWLTAPMDALQNARATVRGGRRSRAAIRHRSNPDSTMSSRPGSSPRTPHTQTKTLRPAPAAALARKIHPPAKVELRLFEHRVASFGS